jgi:hypothetical protein
MLEISLRPFTHVDEVIGSCLWYSILSVPLLSILLLETCTIQSKSLYLCYNKFYASGHRFLSDIGLAVVYRPAQRSSGRATRRTLRRGSVESTIRPWDVGTGERRRVPRIILHETDLRALNAAGARRQGVSADVVLRSRDGVDCGSGPRRSSRVFYDHVVRVCVRAGEFKGAAHA